MPRRALVILVLALALALPEGIARPDSASADHAWGTYHWARTVNPFTLALGDNVSGAWDSYLATTSSDWTASTVLNTMIVSGAARPRNCRPTAGRVEVCNFSYGNNGWLGIAQIWVSGSHITQAVTKLNDTYFNTATYNTAPWRNLVMCQEVGHAFGLGHQDENFDNPNLGSCMDYTRDPDGAGNGTSTDNQHPNSHDYALLGSIYTHTDGSTTVGGVASSPGGASAPGSPFGDEGPNDPAEFGRAAGPRDSFGRPILFERTLSNGRMLFTWVYWVHPGQPGRPH